MRKNVLLLALAALLIFGAESMLIPALCVIVLGLLLLRPRLEEQLRVKGGAAS